MGRQTWFRFQGATPPRNPPARPKIRCKTYQQIRLSNLQMGLGASSARRAFLDWQEGLLLEASSEHGFWDTLWLPSAHGRGSHAEICWWDGQALLRILPDNTFYSQAFVWSKQLKNNNNKPPRDSANSGSPRKSRIACMNFQPKPR